MSEKFILTEVNSIKTGFLISDSKVDEIKCYEDNSLIGNIYVGRVSNILKNINAAFIDIEKGLSCYFSLEDYHRVNPLKIGDLLPVQITKDKIKSKQPTVSLNISLSGEYVVVHTGDNIGVSSKIRDEANRTFMRECFISSLDIFSSEKKCQDIAYGGIIRTKAADIDADTLQNETIKLLCKLDEIMYAAQYSTGYSTLYKSMPAYVSDIASLITRENIEIITDIADIYDECVTAGYQITTVQEGDVPLATLYNLKSVLSKTLSPRAYLKSGAYLVIEQTEAMTVIDVNSGKAIKGHKTQEIIYNINSEAAYEIVRQIKLRNLSGIIIIDFISMKSQEDNAGLMELLRKITANDAVPITVVDMTKLGLVEITRKKIRKPLHEIFFLDMPET